VYSTSFRAIPGSKFVVAVSPVKKQLLELLDLFWAWWQTGSVSASKNAVSAPAVRVVEQRPLSTPVNGWRAENVTEEEQRERAKWIKFPPDPEPIHGRTCQVCRGKLVVEILNYFWDRETDVTAPADTKETCLSCGRATVRIAPARGYWGGPY
jgi:hypothetical protein